jgi:hypothetical protein
VLGGYGAVGYVVILLLVAYGAGAKLFGADWFAAESVDASRGGLVLGWMYVVLRVPRSHDTRVQLGAGSLAVALVCEAWWLARGR